MKGLEERNGREKYCNQFVFSKIKYLLTVKEEDVVVVLDSKHWTQNSAKHAFYAPSSVLIGEFILPDKFN